MIPEKFRVYILQYSPVPLRAIADFRKAEQNYEKWKESNGGRGGFDLPFPEMQAKMPYGDEFTNDEEQLEKW